MSRGGRVTAEQVKRVVGTDKVKSHTDGFYCGIGSHRGRGVI